MALIGGPAFYVALAHAGVDISALALTSSLVRGIGVAGLVCGGFVYFPAAERGAKTLGSALVMVVLWPLWAPFALASPSAPARGPHAARIALALDHPAGSESALQRDETALLLRRVEAAERRLAELDVQLAAMQREEPRLERADPDSVSRAQLRASSIAQLEALRA